MDLFPEMRPNSPSESFGNVFYKSWSTALEQQLGDGAKRKTFHSFRHRAITVLRHDPEVDAAIVRDLVGHKHAGETDGRYRARSDLPELSRVVERIPVAAWKEVLGL